MTRKKPIFRNSDERREWEGGQRGHRAFECLAPWNRTKKKEATSRYHRPHEHCFDQMNKERKD